MSGRLDITVSTVLPDDYLISHYDYPVIDDMGTPPFTPAKLFCADANGVNITLIMPLGPRLIITTPVH